MRRLNEMYRLYLLRPIGRLIIGNIGKVDILLNPLSDTIVSF